MLPRICGDNGRSPLQVIPRCLVHCTLVANVRPIPSDNRRINGVSVNLGGLRFMAVSIYMPCDKETNSTNVYIQRITETGSSICILLISDLNTDFSRHHSRYHEEF